MNKDLKIPKFKSEVEERKYWESIDLSEHFVVSDFENVTFPNLKKTSKSISIRLPEALIFRIKEMANQKDIPYQSLIKDILNEKIYISDAPMKKRVQPRQKMPK